MRADRIPLFPLNVVLLPGADLPLHIFEPRYRKMVRDCLDNKTEFGMLLALVDGVAGTGCTAEILEVVKTYNDGRMDILTVGREPWWSSSRRTRCSKAAWTTSTIATHRNRRKHKNLSWKSTKCATR